MGYDPQGKIPLFFVPLPQVNKFSDEYMTFFVHTLHIYFEIINISNQLKVNGGEGGGSEKIT